ncbi:MAG: TetR/AcrR family transcriptional regulator [Deltaproteobacteria bacterium]|nr:TetR/AcrR family transcriptional regulator [Deltaproteobacteria bacterium]
MSNRTLDKRERILEAATRTFAEKGFFNAKISEIARQAEVADGTIYLYFKNKDDILIQIFEYMVERHLQNIRSAVASGGSPEDKIRLFIRHHFETVEKFPKLVEVITIELRQSSKFMKEYVPKKFFAYLDMVSELIIEGQNSGVFRKDIEAEVIKTALYGSLSEVTVLWLKSKRKRFDLADCGRQIADVFIRGLKT